MIKKNIYTELKERLMAAAEDKLYRFLIAKGSIRGIMVHSTRMIREMAANHDLGILETLVLGQAYIAAALLSSDLRGNKKISINMECSGPVKGFNVEANAFNEVRGYLKKVPIPVTDPPKDFNLSRFIGAGFLTVSKYTDDSKNPYAGTVELKYGSIAKDLAYYFTSSEQLPSSFSLSVQFDRDGNIAGAGGMFLQTMPGADDNIIASIEHLVNNFPSIGSAFSKKITPEELIKDAFSDHYPEIVSETRIEFMCHCSREQMLNYMAVLPKVELADILEKDKFPLEIKCRNCNTHYYYEKPEIEGIVK